MEEEEESTPSKEKPYVCPRCVKRFRSSGDLRRHERIHTETKLLQCGFPNCSFCTHRRDSLRLHEQTHTGIEGRLLHPCPSCAKKFSSEQIAVRHRKTCGKVKEVREVPVRETRCSECGKEFSSVYKLATHMKSHQGLLDFPCSECGKGFASTAALNKHKLSHQRSFQCELCQKQFSRKDNLQAHIQIHVRGEQGRVGGGLVVEFTCSFCSLTVASREALVNHYRSTHEPAEHQVVREEVVEEQEVVREEVVEYGEVEEKEVILVDQEMKGQGVLVIEEPVVYC